MHTVLEKCDYYIANQWKVIYYRKFFIGFSLEVVIYFGTNQNRKVNIYFGTEGVIVSTLFILEVCSKLSFDYIFNRVVQRGNKAYFKY